MQIDVFLLPCKILKSKKISGKPDILNLMEVNEGSSVDIIDTEKDVLKRITLRSTMKTSDLIKLKSFCMQKVTVIGTKQQSTELEKDLY